MAAVDTISAGDEFAGLVAGLSDREFALYAAKAMTAAMDAIKSRSPRALAVVLHIMDVMTTDGKRRGFIDGNEYKMLEEVIGEFNFPPGKGN